MERTRHNFMPFFCLLLLCCVGLLFFGFAGSIQVSTHAVAKHGSDAILASQWVSTHGGPGNRWDCRDGRQRWIVPYGAHEWAIVVMEDTTQITAFITGDQDYVLKQHEGCNQWQNWAHP